MRDRAIRHKCVERSKFNTQKIGVRSISDIISTRKMCFSKKVNYIRHHYTYYEGNYDLFATESGKPNARKFKLNKLIIDVINGKKDASELKEFNKQILEWRKEYDEKETERKASVLANFDGSSIKELAQWEKDIQTATETAKEYIELIKAYVEAHPLESSLNKNLHYKEIKKKAVAWDNLIKYDLYVNEEKDTDDMTPGEYFKYNYIKRIGNVTKPSSCLSLIVKYLDSDDNKKYKKESLEHSKVDALKEMAIQWAILQYINKNQEIIDLVENELTGKLKNRIKTRAGVFDEEDEDKRAYELMKKWSEDITTKEEQEKEIVNE